MTTIDQLHDVHLLAVPRVRGEAWEALVCETCPATLLAPAPHITDEEHAAAVAGHAHYADPTAPVAGEGP